jgi:hypothetical protein
MMITSARLHNFCDFFHMVPSMSRSMSYAGGQLTAVPLYLRNKHDPTVRSVTGKGKTWCLPVDERRRLTAYFTAADPKFGKAIQSM